MGRSFAWGALALGAALGMYSTAAQAGPIWSGSSSFGCETEVLTDEPWKKTAEPGAALPATCKSFVGTWEGGCYWAVMKCPRVTELGDCIMPRPDEVYLDNVWTKADLNAPAKPQYRIQVTQDACKSVTFEGPKDTFFGEKFVLTLNQGERGTAFTRFRRSCDIKSPRPMSWQRTYDMTLGLKRANTWDVAGTRVQQDTDVSGNDPNYGAWFRRVQKWRLYQTSEDALRVDLAYWVGNRNYDPPAVEFYAPDFGGQICIWRRVKNP